MLYKTLREIYLSSLVDDTTRDMAIAALAQYCVSDTLADLGTVYLVLSARWQQEYHPETFAAVNQLSADCIASVGRDDLYWFYNGLCDPMLYDVPRERLVDGMHRGPSNAVVLPLLERLSAERAIHTWFAVCIEWLQCCNCAWYQEEHVRERRPEWSIWQVGAEQDIPRYLAGIYASAYI